MELYSLDRYREFEQFYFVVGSLGGRFPLVSTITLAIRGQVGYFVYGTRKNENSPVPRIPEWRTFSLLEVVNQSYMPFGRYLDFWNDFQVIELVYEW